MTRVFVYGSLMHGYHNHSLLVLGATFLGRHQTLHARFKMGGVSVARWCREVLTREAHAGVSRAVKEVQS